MKISQATVEAAKEQFATAILGQLENLGRTVIEEMEIRALESEKAAAFIQAVEERKIELQKKQQLQDEMKSRHHANCKQEITAALDAGDRSALKAALQKMAAI